LPGANRCPGNKF